MAIIKCKMCGGDMELSADKTFGTCEYCGSTMTLPRVEDDQRAAQFNRGNHFRRSGEFDKALAIYERIVAENDDDAEAHWCCALCRFGIEYVEDPTTLEYLPTCHRASFDSFLEDVDYLAALEHSDGITKRQYQKDAAKIADVQKGILATSQNEEPFDVFICYKESDDATGQRTVDSTLAQDIYYQLTEEGYRVFFSRITLEDKVGTEYEPYIFAALNSAKVMVSIGTKPEHFNAVWVKNEWSRFLAMMRKDRTKLLLPCYRDMDPYDLPEQLSVLQSYDMSKIGFMQDLIRGIKKVLRKDEPKAEPVKETVVVQQTAGGSNVTALLKRGNMALEDGEWKQAKDFFDQVLNADAENAEAYLGLLLADEQCRNLPGFVSRMQSKFGTVIKEDRSAPEPDEARIRAAERKYEVGQMLTEREIRSAFGGFDFQYDSALKSCTENRRSAEAYLIAKKNLVRARKFASGDLQKNLEAAAADILKYCEEAEKQAKQKEEAAVAQKRKDYAAFLDKTENTVKAYYERVCAARERNYQEAVAAQAEAKLAEDYEKAAQLFTNLDGYKDSEARAQECWTAAVKIKDEEIKARRREEAARRREEAARIEKEAARIEKEAAKRKRQKRIRAIVIISAAVVAAVVAWNVIISNLNIKYDTAAALMNEGKYDEAISAFEAVKWYKDSVERIVDCQYNAALALMNEGKYSEAIAAFEAIDGYKDSNEQIVEYKYDVAVELMNESECFAAIPTLEAAHGYKDADALLRDLLASACCTLSARSYHTVGLKSDGTVVAIGLNSDGQCDVSGWQDIVAISAGDSHTVGLKSDGTVVAVGANGSGRCDVSDWQDIVAVSAGERHTVGLKSDGTVVAVGENLNGQCDVSGWKDIVAVSAGHWHTVGLKSDGTVVAVRVDGDDRCDVGGWRDIVAVSAGGDHTVGLKSDGTVVAAGDNYYGQCNVSDWQDIVAVSAGSNNTVGLKSDGTVVAVGHNDYGRCDVSGWQDIRMPY